MEIKTAFLCENIRTPIGRYGGSLSSIRPDDLAAMTIAKLMESAPKFKPESIDDVILGCANQAGEDNRNVARMAGLLADLPITVPGTTINRLCGSGMDAIGMAARSVASGDAQLILAGGVESMSRAPMVLAKSTSAFSRNAEIYDTTIGWRFVNPEMQKQYGVDGMPITAENVADEYNITREDQDAFALRSQQKADAGWASGRLAEEVFAISISQRKSDPIVFEKDEHPTANSTLDALSKLRTPFKEGGTVTAGNASGVNDGAAAVIVASEKKVAELDLMPMVRIVGTMALGVEPRLMGMGPAPAAQKLLAKHNLKIADMDVIEINEAFASQSLAVLRELGLPDDAEHVNPNGGAIALGHPLGMSGARIVMTAARELKRRNGRYALCAMCIGVGQGIAMLLEAADNV